MINNGLFSRLFIDDMRSTVTLDDQGEGRFATLTHLCKSRDATSSDSLWNSFCKQALSGIEFVPANQAEGDGFYPLYEDWGFSNALTVVLVLGADADIDDTRVGRFWPVKLVKKLRQRQLTWGILTNGEVWRLYSTKTAKPYEDYVELPLARALDQQDRTEYALFERFFHANSFLPEDDESDGENDGENDSGDTGVRVYKCPLDRDTEKSEQILEDRVKKPLLSQVDEVLQYICNGFIADTARQGEDYTEEERGEIFQSAVKLLYRCMFLFYAESRKLLPSDEGKRQEYDSRFSIRHLCLEARKFSWHERTDTESFDLWYHLKGLVRAVNEGDPEYGIMGYNGGLFDDEQEAFLGQHRLRNDFLARALYLMSHVRPLPGQDQEAEYEIPFRDLEVRHLGELYENILEFNVLLAEVPRIRRRTANGVQTLLASETTFSPATDTRIEKGQVYFAQTALERKQSGSYYTPESLVGFLVNKAVVAPLRERFDTEYRPRLDEFAEQTRTGFDEHYQHGAAREAEALVLRFINDVVLKFRVCDPAMGSGHFLVSAANRLTDFAIDLLDEVPSRGNARASEATSRPNHWRRQVTRNCVYGVDLNPLAVDLARLSLWLNSFATDHKLTFLDHRLKHGNSLMGIRSLEALNRIPKRKKRNPKKGKAYLGGLFSHTMLATALDQFRKIGQASEDDTETQRQLYGSAMDDLRGTLKPLADAYTTYLTVQDISPETYRAVVDGLSSGRNGALLDTGEIQAAQEMQAELSDRHKFFHWPLEFPDVFGGQEKTGFDATVGNPPWDIVKPNSQEFFCDYDPAFRSYDKKEAKRVSERMVSENLAIGQKWQKCCESFEEQSLYFRQPDAFPAIGSGDINTFKLFLEQFFRTLSRDGCMGIVVPSGLYTDKGCQPLRELFFGNSRIDSLFCFENRRAIFSIHRSFKFIVFCTRKGGKTESFRCAFMEHDPDRLPVIDACALMMTLDQIRKFSPDTLGVMEFRSQRDIELTDRLYGDHQIIGNGWKLTVARELDLTTHSSMLHASECGGPSLFEGKTIHQFNSSYSAPQKWIGGEDYVALYKRDTINRASECLPYSSRDLVDLTVNGRIDLAPERYRLAFREVARSTDERTMIAAILSPPCPHSYTLRTFEHYSPVLTDMNIAYENQYSLAVVCFWCGVLNSHPFDFVARIKTTYHLSTTYMDLPLADHTTTQPIFGSIALHVLRLTCITDDFSALWHEVFPTISICSRAKTYPKYGPLEEQQIRQRLADSARTLTSEWGPHCGVHDRTADRRDMGDRAQLRAEIDAYVAHLYGLSRDDFSYILDTFPVLERKEEKAFGEFMSKRKCLEEYDRLAAVLADAGSGGTA